MINSWNELYRQLWMQSAESRGVNAAAQTGYAVAPAREWPSSTLGDVATIISVVDPLAHEALAIGVDQGGDGALHLWQAAVVDVDAALGSELGDTYEESEPFWTALLTLFAHFEAAGISPPARQDCEAMLAALWLPSSVRNAAGGITHVITEGSASKMWDRQHAEMIQLRGFDVQAPTGSMGGGPMQVPRATNADAVRIADYWTQQLQTFLVKIVLGSVSSSMGLEGQSKRWSVVVADINQLARPGQPDGVYAKNHELWREARELATNLDVWGEVPTPYELAVSSVGQAIGDLPDRLARATGSVARAVGNIAGNIVHEAGAGLTSPFGKPLLVGGGVALALYLLLRRRPTEHEVRSEPRDERQVSR